MITKSYTIQKDSYPLIIDKKMSREVVSSSSFVIKNNLENSTNLSFKGAPPIKPSDAIKVSEAVKKFGEIFGKSAEAHLNERIKKAASQPKSGITIKDDVITFAKKTMGRQILDILLYPILKMPLDIANGFLKLLKKLPGLKKSKTIDKWLDSKVLKERREYVKNTSDVAAIEHYFEMLNQKTKKELHVETNKIIEKDLTDADKAKSIFKSAHDRFKPLLSNYDTTTERTLTRIVTGIIPAFFLANDAYNLSMYMKNNKHDAEKDKKRRFNQEVVRIGITAAFTFATMSIFAKKTNESKAFATLLSTGVVLVSETVGRWLAGTPVLPIGETQAKKYAEIQNKKYDKHDQKQEDEHHGSFKGLSQDKESKKPAKEGGLTLKNVLKWVGILAIAGLGVDKAKNIESIKKVLDNTNKKYKNLYQKEFTISRDELNKIILKLKNNGFEEIAKKYESIIAKQAAENKNITISKDNKTISLGKVNDKTKEILIHQILTFPVRYAWNTLMTPYKYILKPIWNMIDKNIIKSVPGAEEAKAIKKKDAEASAKKEMEMLRNSIQFLQKNAENKNYKEEVSKSILSSLDNLTKSSYSNSDLAAITKIGTSGTASAFLIADNYNQVMIESNGQDKELAEQKAKERAIQRGIRLAYSASLVSLFNGIFAGPYNGSLLGAQAVNVGNTFLIEALERKSVGLPLKEASREEIIRDEQKNLSATGLKGGYFRTMAKLTGKKSLSAAAVAKEKKEQRAKSMA